jgi:hypothetical protein
MREKEREMKEKHIQSNKETIQNIWNLVKSEKKLTTNFHLASIREPFVLIWASKTEAGRKERY